MVAGLATLTKLESLRISFEPSSGRQWDYSSAQRLGASLTRIVLPALTQFLFVGACEYLEEFVGQIETPQLTNLKILFSSLEGVSQVPKLFQFVCHVEYIKLAEFRHARIYFHDVSADIHLDCSQAECHPCYLDLTITYHLPWRDLPMIPLLTQFVSQSSLITSNVHNLSFNNRAHSSSPSRYENSTWWLALLRPFTAVETLRTCGPLAREVFTALEDSTNDMVMEVLPMLYGSFKQYVVLDWPLDNFVTITSCCEAISLLR